MLAVLKGVLIAFGVGEVLQGGIAVKPSRHAKLQTMDYTRPLNRLPK